MMKERGRERERERERVINKGGREEGRQEGREGGRGGRGGKEAERTSRQTSQMTLRSDEDRLCAIRTDRDGRPKSLPRQDGRFPASKESFAAGTRLVENHQRKNKCCFHVHCCLRSHGLDRHSLQHHLSRSERSWNRHNGIPTCNISSCATLFTVTFSITIITITINNQHLHHHHHVHQV